MVFTPDGKHALAAKSSANKIPLPGVDGDKVTYAKHDLPTGLFPYNVVASPNGAIALTADNGNNGGSDGVFAISPPSGGRCARARGNLLRVTQL